MRRLNFFSFVCLLCITAFPRVSDAHFLWLLAEGKGSDARVQVFFGEAAEADDPALLDKVATAEVWSVEGRGGPQALKLTRQGESLAAPLSASAAHSPIILRHNYGVVAKGGEPFLLKYYAKAYPFPLPGSWQSVNDADKLPLEITPELHDSELRLRVTWQGKTLAGSTITIVGPGIESKVEGNTDADGVFAARLPQAGIYSIRAKHSEAQAGSLDDKPYASIRHYSTLTLRHAPATVSLSKHDLPALPQGTTSFGGAIAGDQLFVYGGNYGSAHEYANEDQSGDLWSLDLKKPGTWQKVSGGPKLQGLAMVAHGGQLYRVGGFTAMNREGEEQDLRSQAEFARWNASNSTWESLPDLPEPRSSHDAAVVGDKLYVVGGWQMSGGGSTAKWHETAWSLALGDASPAWKPIAPPPFKRRALALAAWNGKLYCVGGMTEKGGPTTAVSVYDPKSNSWSEGPHLLGGAMDGFGSSAFATRDGLYVTTVTGSIQRLAGEAKDWEYVGQIDQPRFFHRLLSWNDDRLVVVGGASMSEGKREQLEVIVPSSGK